MTQRKQAFGAGKEKNPGKTALRLFSYITGGYKARFCLVLFCILLNAGANVVGSLFIETLIDDYISPLLLEANPVFDGLLRAILFMAIKLMGIEARDSNASFQSTKNIAI